MPIKNTLLHLYTVGLQCFSKLSSLALLGIRLWLFKAFFFSGWLKTKNWASTVYLFENEYQVPLFPAEVAAFIGTIAEITLPCLLLIGICSRYSASFLFLFNIAIVCCYPFLWTPDGTNGLYEHVYLGLMILVIMTEGPGKISLDYLIKKKFSRYEY